MIQLPTQPIQPKVKSQEIIEIDGNYFLKTEFEPVLNPITKEMIDRVQQQLADEKAKVEEAIKKVGDWSKTLISKTPINKDLMSE